MKRILITGASSWVGGELAAHLARFPYSYEVERVSLRDGSWREVSWKGFDSVVHLAAAADSGKGALERCRAVNRDLTAAAGRKAKSEGVPHFVFASTMHVYASGCADGVGEPVTFSTEPAPETAYGVTKLEGERVLSSLSDDSFCVAILRIPLVYGPGCKGNFSKLAKLARVAPSFPDVRNKRSIIYSRNLSELIRLLIEKGRGGLFLPQDAEPVSTPDLVRLLAEIQGSPVRISKALAPAARAAARRSPAALKVFGSSWYDPAASDCGLDYRIVAFEEGLLISVVGGAR